MSATEPAPTAPAAPEAKLHKIGHFIEKYSTFLSSFVLGLAGLIGTALYQQQQTKIAQKQAEAQIAVSQNQAETQWKIARAEILSKNLQVLLDKKPETTDQRYGVLLSLTREDVLDPELAMSYAFDLDNSDYIESVILNIQRKSWAQIFHNFNLTCELRFGVVRDVPVCKDLDRYEARADALADVVSEELGRGSKDPLRLLSDEKQVRSHLMRLVYLFSPYLQGAYARQRYSEIETFEAAGKGAQLLSAFALAADPSGEAFLSAEGAAERTKFHDLRRQRLEKFVLDPSCDVECKGLAAEVLLNGLKEFGDAYAGVLRALVLQHGVDGAQVFARLHRRLLWCQRADEDASRLLHDVLVPAWSQISQGSKKDKGREHALDAIADLISLIDVPEGEKLPEAIARAVDARRARARKERETPPPSVRRANFCGAKDLGTDSVDSDP